MWQNLENVVNVCTIAAACLLGLIVRPVAAAADNQGVFAFARANANRYTTELRSVGGVQVGNTVTLRGKLDADDMENWLPQYEPQDELVVFGAGDKTSSLYSLLLVEHCLPAGSYIGSNAFGVRARVKRERCDRLFAMALEVADLSGARMHLTPTQYRSAKATGLVVEMDFTIEPGGDSMPATFETSVDRPTIDEPTESQMKTWTVYGRIDEVRFLAPGTMQPTVVFRRGATGGNAAVLKPRDSGRTTTECAAEIGSVANFSERERKLMDCLLTPSAPAAQSNH